MSKIYEKYIELKTQDKEKVYLIKSGMFYIAVDEDAKLLSDKIYLKLTNLTKNIKKVGFPVNNIEEYKKRLEYFNIKYQIVEIETKTYSKIINEIRCVDILNTTQEELKNFIIKLKEDIMEVDKI